MDAADGRTVPWNARSPADSPSGELRGSLPSATALGSSPCYRDNGTVTDRETLRVAAQAAASVMRRRQAEHQVRTDGGWVEPDPDLLDLVVECEDVIYSRRPEEPDLTERLAAVLGDDWEP